MKRKLSSSSSEEDQDTFINERPRVKKRVVTDEWAKSHFQEGLFDRKELEAQTERYSKSQP